MKIGLNIILILILMGCENKVQMISYNPFQPNYSINVETIKKNGFELKIACDGGLNTYSKIQNDYELSFFEDCINTGMIIGENYCFPIDTIKSFNWEKVDTILIDFNQYRYSIENIISRFDGKLIEPSGYTSVGIYNFSVRYLNNNIFKCILEYQPDGILILSIENWYRNNYTTKTP